VASACWFCRCLQQARGRRAARWWWGAGRWGGSGKVAGEEARGAVGRGWRHGASAPLYVRPPREPVHRREAPACRPTPLPPTATIRYVTI